MAFTTFTASDLIRGALELIGAASPGDRISSEDFTTGMYALNDFMDACANESLLIYVSQDFSASFTTNQATCTIGLPSGDIAQPRPVNIETAFIRLNGNQDYDLTIIDIQDYESINLKRQQGFPTYLYYAPELPLGIITVVPQYQAPCEVHVLVPLRLTQFVDFTTAYTFPPGYKRMITFNLAMELAPRFRQQPNADVARIAAGSKRTIKRSNSRAPTMSLDESLPGQDFYYGVND